MRKKKAIEITEYDEHDTSLWIDPHKRLSLKDLGVALPPQAPTQVVSIRLSTPLLNQIRAKASEVDIPYQALIKMILAEYV